MAAAVSEQTVSIAGVFAHPVKSCARIALDQALLTETGLEWDRQRMVVDEQGRLVTTVTLLWHQPWGARPSRNRGRESLGRNARDSRAGSGAPARFSG